MKSIYVFESNRQFKIGVSQDVGARLKVIKTGNPNVQTIYESEKVTNAHTVEAMIHKYFSNYRTSGEWFSIPQEIDVIKTVKGFVEKYGKQEKIQKVENTDSTGLLKRLFSGCREEIEKMDDEIKEINAENEILKEKLRSLGWSDFEIRKLEEDAVRSVLSQV